MAPSPLLGRRRLVVAGGSALGVALTVSLIVALPSSSPATGTRAPAKVLFASLQAVTCATQAECVAVGDFLPLDKDAARGDPDGDGKASHTLVESFDAGHWTRDPSPDVGHGGDELSAVSCPTVDDCVAVGFDRPGRFPSWATTAPPSDPLIESESKGRWRIVAGPSVAPDSVLTAVSCPSPADCTAVGTTVSESGGIPLESLLVETFDGRSWRLLPVSGPAGTVSALNAVSCPSTSACVAVGDVAVAAHPTVTRPLVETMADGAWTTAALPSSGTGQGILYGVSCPAVGQCVAAGNAVTGASTGAALVLSLSGSDWSVDQSALGQSGDPSLTALGCADVDHCLVSGTALESAAKVLAQVDGAGWRSLTAPAFSDNVEGVTCPTDGMCLVVGNAYVNGFGNTRALTAVVSAGTWTAELNPAR